MSEADTSSDRADLEARISALEEQLADVSPAEPTRRRFLKGAGVLGAAGLLGGVGGAAADTGVNGTTAALGEVAPGVYQWSDPAGYAGPAASRTNITPETGALHFGWDPDAPTIARGNGSSWVDLIRGDDVVTVRSVGEFDAALGSEPHIRLGADLELDAERSGTYAGEDIVLDLAGHTIARADTTPENLLTIDNPNGRVLVGNGRLDCNRPGQNFGSGAGEEKGYKELTIRNAAECHVDGLRIVDNQGFSMNLITNDHVMVTNCVVRTNPSGLGNEAAGLDGVHVFDAETCVLVGCDVESGDDAVALTARDTGLSKVALSGCSLSAPEYANGLKVYIDSSAGAGVGLEYVSIAATDVGPCSGNGIIINNEGANGEGITELSIQATVHDTAGGDGLLVDVPVQNAHVAGTFRALGGGGILFNDSGRNVTVSATVEDVTGSLVALNSFDGASISGTFDGAGNASRGIQLVGCSNVSVAGSHVKDVASHHGVNGDNCTDVTVTGCTFSGGDRAVNSFNGSDYWTVIACQGDVGNATAINLAGTNNNAAAADNNFR